MIEISNLLSSLENQLANKLPFVVFKKAGANQITAILQDNSDLNYFRDKDQEGFVFARFNDIKPPVIFNKKDGETLRCLCTLETKALPNRSVEYNLTDEDNYLQSVRNCIETIKNSDIKKIVLSRREGSAVDTQSPIKLFEKLLRLDLHAFSYLWYHPKIGCWIGATPERLIELNGPFFKTMALAGTSLKSDTWTEKEIAEHQYVTDFITTRLKSLTKTMSIGDTETINAGNIFHLKTKISGIIKNQDLDMLNILHRLHPTPAVCGLPMDQAKEYILNNEDYDREFYTGYLGELNTKKSVRSERNKRNVENQAYLSDHYYSDIYVNLRCMKLTENEAYIYVGGGITEDSDPVSEWKETINKSHTMKQLLEN